MSFSNDKPAFTNEDMFGSGMNVAYYVPDYDELGWDEKKETKSKVEKAIK